MLRRPTRQSAWAYVCQLGYDFENEQIELLTFERNKNDVLYFSNKFNFGYYLFPDEVLLHVANRIINTNTISNIFFYEAIDYLLGNKVNKDEIMYKANIFLEKENGIHIIDRKPLNFTRKQIKKIKDDYTEDKCKEFLGNVGARLVFSP